MLLRKRAEDLLNMADKITTEFSAMDDVIGGNIYLGLAGTWQIRYLARAIRRFKERYQPRQEHILNDADLFTSSLL